MDARLKSVVLERLQFMHHCNTLKSLLFFEQGDFASALLHQFAMPTEKAPSRNPQRSDGPPQPPLLDRRANEVCVLLSAGVSTVGVPLRLEVPVQNVEFSTLVHCLVAAPHKPG